MKRGKNELAKIVLKIKEDGQLRNFDCIMIMCGGPDRS